MTISFYKRLTRNRKMRNTPVLLLPNIGRRGQDIRPNLAWTSLMECYWMLWNSRVTAFTTAALFRENQQGIKTNPCHPCLKLVVFLALLYKAVLHVFFSFFYLSSLVKLVNWKNKGADLMKNVQLFYFHFISAV